MKKKVVKSAVLLSAVFVVFSCMRDPYVTPSRRTFQDFDKELFVINTLAETVSVINGDDTNEVYSDVFTTGMWPNHCLFHRGNIYFVNSGDNNITVYNESTFEYLGEIYLGPGSNPWMVIQKTGTDTAWVPCFASGDMVVVDLESLTAGDRIQLGNGPEGGTYQDGKVYVGNTAWDYQSFDFGEGTVSVVDGGTGEPVKTITVGINPQSVIPFPDLHEVHVICTGKNGGAGSDDGKVIVIDTLTDTVTANIEIGGSPVGGIGGIDSIANRVYLSGVGGILCYNYITKAVINGSGNYLLEGQDTDGDFFSGLVVDEDYRRLYVCFFSNDSIIEIDLESLSLVKEIEGSDGPQSVYLYEE